MAEAELELARARVRELEAEQKRLRRSEGLLRAQYQGLPMPAFTWRRSGDDIVLVDYNQAALTVTEGGISEFVGTTAEALYGSDAPDIMADLQQCLAGRQPIRREIPYRFRSTGRVKDLVVTYVPVSQDVVMVLAEDITDRKQTEEESVRLERLRALEEMGSGVAHNFNNLLVGVLGYAQLIQIKTEDEEIRAFLGNIVSSAMRAKALVERLNVALHTGKREDIAGVNVGSAIQEVVDACKPIWKDGAEANGVRIDISVDASEAPPVAGTHEGMNDILTNLILNAVDALPGGGKILIAARQVAGEVCLTVEDNGIGMNEETRRRVFEPFFTSKSDIGTGLGLAVAHTTAVRWGGRATVASREGEGTVFTFCFPIWDGEDAAGPEEGEADAVGQHPRRILVIDDDEMVRNLIRDALSGEFEVTVFEDGAKALASFEPGQYDVALIDLGMPDMPGDQVAARVQELDPSVARVLITGWSMEREDPRLSAFDFHLTKPFSDLRQAFQLIRKAGAVHDAREREGVGQTDG